MGEGLSGLGIKELQNLESKLETSLRSIRTKKVLKICPMLILILWGLHLYVDTIIIACFSGRTTYG